MKKEDVRNRLTKQGYKVISVMDGRYMVQKGQRTYMADSLNELWNKIN